MFLRPASCPTCGAPIPEASIGRSFATCAHCKAAFAFDGRAVFRAPYRRSLEEAEARVAARGIRLRDRTYVPELVLSRSERALVVLAHTEVPAVERVVLKLARDGDHLERERAALAALATATVRGRGHFTTRVPEVVAHGVATLDGVQTPALAVRARGALHTMRDVAAAHPEGLEGRHVVWMWRRVLEVLGFAHQAGRAHRRVTEDHLVVAPRDHGVLIVGWAGSTPLGGTGARDDLAALARVLLGLSAPLPEPLGTLLRASRDGAHAEAWVLADAVGHAARQAYGPPAFHPFTLPPFHR